MSLKSKQCHRELWDNEGNLKFESSENWRRKKNVVPKHLKNNSWKLLELPKDLDVQIQQPEQIIERKCRNSHLRETEMVLTHNEKTILRMGFF